MFNNDRIEKLERDVADLRRSLAQSAKHHEELAKYMDILMEHLGLCFEHNNGAEKCLKVVRHGETSNPVKAVSIGCFDHVANMIRDTHRRQQEILNAWF